MQSETAAAGSSIRRSRKMGLETRTSGSYASLKSVVCLEWNGLFTHVSDLFTVRCHKPLRSCFALEFDTWEHSFKHHMHHSSRISGQSDFYPSGDFLRARFFDFSPQSIVTLDWLSSPAVCLVC